MKLIVHSGDAQRAFFAREPHIHAAIGHRFETFFRRLIVQRVAGKISTRERQQIGRRNDELPRTVKAGKFRESEIAPQFRFDRLSETETRGQLCQSMPTRAVAFGDA